ncbi:MAG: glutamate--tRNA ligase [Sulfurovum sp.]|nr:glutamate--tRNA ligase [Sulfurovum sp.]MDD3499398.1 glutamate--tRNA ligase [Sulfurovum sp.]
MLRFAPSPTGDMHIENLRVAIFNYMVAKQRDVNFIVRIEDTDKERNITGKDTEIMEILEKFALPHDSVMHQSENLHLHQTLAIRLLEEKKAFVCTCKDTESSEMYREHCSTMGAAELAKLKEEKTPFVIRIKKPDTAILIHDLIKGDIETKPNEVDAFVILREDSTPTDIFAGACDDMISGISLVIQGEEYLSRTPKQEHIKRLLGYDQETAYVHLPSLLDTDEAHTVKWFFEQGFIPDAIANYLIALGNQTPQEIFTMPEALEWFDLTKLSNSPVKFDIERLRFINCEHLKMIDDKRLSALFGFADEAIGKLAKVYLEEEAGTINELEAKIRPIFKPKDFSVEWGEQMKQISDVIFDAPMINTYEAFESYIIEKTGLSGENLSKPLRYLLTGTGHGPELSDIYPYIKSYILEVAS